ncbi:MAG TPA: RidA family protein [Spirochaetia bacterium]|nr:RidA family protein [Spirochaetia bacterium]
MKSEIRHPKFRGLAPTGSSYSTAVETAPGRLLFVSGQLPVDRDGKPVGGSSMEAQATQIFENLKSICEECGVGMDRIIKLNCYVADLSRFGEVRTVRERYLKPPYPAATAVGAQVMGGFLLEIEMVLALD